jgi:flagellar biosynthesis/type III secretory pathway protein FliH
MRSVSLRTPDEFISLAATLTAPAVAAAEALPEIEIADDPLDEADAMREVRLFRARLAEALDSAVEQMLCDIASGVLGRELRLAPADIKRIIDRALQRYAAEEPLRVRVHPGDAAKLQCGVPIIADAQLRRGDAIVELRDGFIDASLGVRLDAVLRACAP